MDSSLKSDLLNFRQEALEHNFHVRLDIEGYPYNQAREISNSRFDFKPCAVAFPRNADQLKKCFDFCTNHKLNMRLRSGGHQHEGMSSGNGIFMVRLSEMNFIHYKDHNIANIPEGKTYITPLDEKEKSKAWIGVGCKLKNVYDELEFLHQRMIPGGGCWNVNVGGLTQGGGWGMNARKHGLTCDNILAAEILLANGEVEVVSNSYKPDLFKAIRGGGGGNFGIVTRFLFRLHPISEDLSSVNIQWKRDADVHKTAEKIKTALNVWLNNQYDTSNDLTSIFRLNFSNTVDYAASIYMLYHGPVTDLKNPPKPLTKDYNFVQALLATLTQEDAVEWKTLRKSKGSTTRSVNATDHSPLANLSLAEFFNYDKIFNEIATEEIVINATASLEEADCKDYSICKVPIPSSTCDKPHPHKVSSGFSVATQETNEEYYKEVSNHIADYYKKTTDSLDPKYVRYFMAFHSIGGAIKDLKEATSFGFRDSEFLMQYQTWWNYPDKNDKTKCCFKDQVDKHHQSTHIKPWEQPYVDWVNNLREYMEKFSSGAFINFIDKNIPLKDYYGSEENFEQLKATKAAHDPGNIFSFPMSIPPAKK